MQSTSKMLLPPSLAVRKSQKTNLPAAADSENQKRVPSKSDTKIEQDREAA